MNVSRPGSSPPPSSNRQDKLPPRQQVEPPKRSPPPTPPDSRGVPESLTSLPRAIYWGDETPRIYEVVKRVLEGTDLPVEPKSYEKRQVTAWLQDVIKNTGTVDVMLSMLPNSSKQWLKQHLSDRQELAELDRFINADPRDPEPEYILKIILLKKLLNSDKYLVTCNPLSETAAENFTTLLKERFPTANKREELIESIKPEVRKWLEESNVEVSLTDQGKAKRAIDAYADGDKSALTIYPNYPKPGDKPGFINSATKVIKKLFSWKSSEEKSLKSPEMKNLAVSMSKVYPRENLGRKYKEILHEGIDSRRNSRNREEQMAVALALLFRMSSGRDEIFRKLNEPSDAQSAGRTRSHSLGDKPSKSRLSTSGQTSSGEASHLRTHSVPLTGASIAAAIEGRPPRQPKNQRYDSIS